jgi:hypothetical protein
MTPESAGEFDTLQPMRAPGPQNPYEVYCYRCHVTAPVGTRRCIHCGEPIARGGSSPRRAALSALIEREFGEPDEQGEEEVPASIGSIVPKIAMWILILFGGFFYRFCN